MDVGCYAVNLSRMLFGTEPDRIGASVTRDQAMGVDVLTSAILGFGESVATFTCSTRAAHDQRVRSPFDYQTTNSRSRPVLLRGAGKR